MKKIVLALALISTLTSVFAQSTSHIATLQHNGRVRTFYNNTALREALAASVSGDTICLSGGTFLSDTIRHNITILGLGYKGHDTEESWVAGDMYIRIPSTDTVGRLRLEGIGFFNTVRQDSVLHAPYIVRCYFSSYRINTNKAYFNGQFVNCRIKEYNSQDNIAAGANVIFVNSIIYNLYTSSSSYDEFRNCFVRYLGRAFYSDSYDRLNHSRLINCFIQDVGNSNSRYGGYNLPSEATAINCVAIGVDANNYFRNVHGYGNRVITSWNEFFETYDGNYYDYEDFMPTDSAKTAFLGNDSTQVGIYGGAVPFTTVPSYPHISWLSTGRTVNADGKLEVEIRVGDGE